MILWWGWDGNMTDTVIRRDLDRIKAMGFRGVMVEAAVFQSIGCGDFQSPVTGPEISNLRMNRRRTTTPSLSTGFAGYYSYFSLSGCGSS